MHLVESNPDAVTAATASLKALSITHAHMHPGTAESVLPGLLEKTGPVDVVIADPPRAGMTDEALDALKALRPRQIVYVSCRPTSLVRDARKLWSEYTLTAVQSVDMFPHTPHVEAIGLLSLNATDTTRTP